MRFGSLVASLHVASWVSGYRIHLPNPSIKGDGVRVAGRDHPYRQDFHAPVPLIRISTGDTAEQPLRSSMLVSTDQFTVANFDRKGHVRLSLKQQCTRPMNVGLSINLQFRQPLLVPLA